MRSFRIWLPRLMPLVFALGGLVAIVEKYSRAIGPVGDRLMTPLLERTSQVALSERELRRQIDRSVARALVDPDVRQAPAGRSDGRARQSRMHTAAVPGAAQHHRRQYHRLRQAGGQPVLGERRLSAPAVRAGATSPLGSPLDATRGSDRAW